MWELINYEKQLKQIDDWMFSIEMTKLRNNANNGIYWMESDIESIMQLMNLLELTILEMGAGFVKV